MIFTTISGDQYTIPIALGVENLNYNSFNNYVAEYLSNIDSNIKEKLNDHFIQYIYGNIIINSENYNNIINTNEITLGIIYQKLPQIYSTSNAFAMLTSNGDIISWGAPELLIAKFTRNIVKLTRDYCIFPREDPEYISKYISKFNNIKSQLKNIKELYSTNNSFLAIDNDDNVITWGTPWLKGRFNYIKSHGKINYIKSHGRISNINGLRKNYSYSIYILKLLIVYFSYYFIKYL